MDKATLKSEIIFTSKEIFQEEPTIETITLEENNFFITVSVKAGMFLKLKLDSF
jgi:hypothetical protein